MNRTVQFLIGLISILTALVIGYLGRNMYLKEVSTDQIPVPTNPISSYTLLDQSMFQMREVPKAVTAMSYYGTLEELDGKISVVTLPVDLPVPQTQAVSVESFRLADADMEVISIPIEPVSAVGGQIRIGERINLYRMVLDQQTNNLSGEQDSRIRILCIAEDVLVVDVRNAQGAAAEAQQSQQDAGVFSSQTQQEQVQILTLAVSPGMVGEILDAVAASKKQGELLWTTLAIP
jgi:hypothetical protein